MSFTIAPLRSGNEVLLTLQGLPFAAIVTYKEGTLGYSNVVVRIVIFPCRFLFRRVTDLQILGFGNYVLCYFYFVFSIFF